MNQIIGGRMNKPQTKTELYGRPQGNEMIDGRLILRMIGPFKFKKVAYFDSYLEANRVFYEWLEENK
jgi:hypothetical protein